MFDPYQEDRDYEMVMAGMSQAQLDHENTGRVAMTNALADSGVEARKEALEAGQFCVVYVSPVYSDCDAIFGWVRRLVSPWKTYDGALRELRQFTGGEEPEGDPSCGYYTIDCSTQLTWEEARAKVTADGWGIIRKGPDGYVVAKN